MSELFVLLSLALREPQLIIATGRKAVGKTYQTILAINRYTKDDASIGKKGRKVLIYDVNQEYSSVKTLPHKEIVRYTLNSKVEIRRIVPIKEDGRPMGVDEMCQLLYKILEEFKGGLLVLEDINRYLIDTRTTEIIGAIATNRQRDLDIICHLQSLSAMTTRMWQNTSVVRFHYQMDDIFRYKNRIPNYEMFKIAQSLVNLKYHGGKKRFFVYVYREEESIRGLFSKADFKDACVEYLNDSPKIVATTAQRFGGREEGRKKAIDFLCNDLMKYYGGVLN